MSSAQVAELKALLQEYSNVFATELGCTDVLGHSIDTSDHRPIRLLHYQTPIAQRDAIKILVNQMQQQGMVRPSSSPWASPVVLVPKKDGSVCFCVDYHNLNAITSKDVFPLPRVEIYWQIELNEDASIKSAFTTLQWFIRVHKDVI